MLVLGDQEQNDGTISVRSRAENTLFTLGVPEFIQQLTAKIDGWE